MSWGEVRKRLWAKICARQPVSKAYRNWQVSIMAFRARLCGALKVFHYGFEKRLLWASTCKYVLRRENFTATNLPHNCHRCKWQSEVRLKINQADIQTITNMTILDKILKFKQFNAFSSNKTVIWHFSRHEWRGRKKLNALELHW